MGLWQEEVVLDGALAGGCFDRGVVSLRELPMADGVFASTGNQLWPSSVLLAYLILRRHAEFRDRDVLEIGAGCGLCGITSARFARSTRITDADEEVVRNIGFNISANADFWQASPGEPERCVKAEQLNWDDVISSPPQDDTTADGGAGAVDIIIASEIVYGYWGDRVAEAMLRLLTPSGKIFMLTSADRRGGIPAFVDTLNNAGFVVLETTFALDSFVYHLYEARMRLGEEAFLPPAVATADKELEQAVRVSLAMLEDGWYSGMAAADEVVPTVARRAPVAKRKAKAKAAKAKSAKTGVAEKKTPAESSQSTAVGPEGSSMTSKEATEVTTTKEGVSSGVNGMTENAANGKAKAATVASAASEQRSESESLAKQMPHSLVLTAKQPQESLAKGTPQAVSAKTSKPQRSTTVVLGSGASGPATPAKGSGGGEMRFADDGKLYTYKDFVQFWGTTVGQVNWRAAKRPPQEKAPQECVREPIAKAEKTQEEAALPTTSTKKPAPADVPAGTTPTSTSPADKKRYADDGQLYYSTPADDVPAGTASTSPADEKRYADDGQLYSYADFLRYFGNAAGRHHWLFARRCDGYAVAKRSATTRPFR